MEPSEKNPGVAAVLSFVVPGLGQVYCEQIRRGVALFAATTTLVILAFSNAAYRGHQERRVMLLQTEAEWQMESAIRWQQMALRWKRMADSPSSREGLADVQQKSAECEQRSREADKAARQVVRMSGFGAAIFFLLPVGCWIFNIFDAARRARGCNAAPSLKQPPKLPSAKSQVLPSPPLPKKKEWPWEGDVPTLR